MDVHGSGRDWRGNKRPQDPTMCGHICGSICLLHRNAKRSKNGPSRNPNSIVPKNYVVSSSIEPGDEEFKRIMKSARGKLEIPMPAAMSCRIQHPQHRETCGIIGQRKIKYAFIVEADEFTRMRMDGSLHKYHGDHIAGKGMNSLSHCNLVHKFIHMSQSMKIPDAKAAVEKEWEKLEKILAWQLTKVKNKSEVIDEARTKGHTVHFASLMDLCHLKNSELEPQFQKYKGRVVLRGDIAKDDSGSYAVFTEQGSSASQVTAAKVMDIMSRLPGCAEQAADAVSHFSSLCCAKNLILFSCITERMAKRMQEQSEENRIVAKSRPMVMNLTSSVATNCASVDSPVAARSRDILKASSRQVGLSGRLDANANQNSNPDAASRLAKGCFTVHQHRLWATGKDQKSLNRQEESVISTGKLVATEHQGYPENPQTPKDSGHHFRLSPHCADHMEKAFSIVKKLWSDTDG